MSDYIKYIGGIIIILLAFIGGCSLFDNNKNIDRKIEKTTIVDTVYNTITDTIYKKSVPIVYEILVHDTVIKNNVVTKTDTIEIIKNFFKKRLYSDTLSIGNYGYVVVEDTIYNNKISSRKYFYEIDIPKVIVTNTIKETIEYKPKKFRSNIFSDISISEDKEWDRSLRVGGSVQYAIIKNNYVGVSGDLINRDIIATYDINSKKVDVSASYSINKKYLDLSAKYWITR